MIYRQIHLSDLPSEEFSIKFKSNNILLNIVKKARENFRFHYELIEFIKKRCKSLNKLTLNSAIGRLNNCINGIFYTPLDCITELCNLLEINLNSLEGEIDYLSVKYIKNPVKIKLPFLINEDFVTISEIIRTEGFLSKNLRHIELSNSDTRILKMFMKSLKAFKINITSKLGLYTKITVPNGITKNDLKIIDENNREIKGFAIRYKNTKRGLKNQIHIHDYNVLIPDKKKYKIVSSNFEINTSINIPKKGLMNYDSSFKDCIGSNITSSVKVRVNNIVLGKILNLIAEIPKGKKSNLIYLPKIIKESPKSVLKKAFEVTFNCEGNIDKYQIRIKSISNKFLNDWRNILKEQFSIDSTINANDLRITHKENFLKLYNNFEFLNEERIKIEKMTKGTLMLHPNTARSVYLTKFNELKESTIQDFSNYIRKSKGHAKKVLSKLYKEGFIDKRIILEKGIKRYQYFKLN